MPMAFNCFVVPDLREPGQRMAALQLRIPSTGLEALQEQADRLRCGRVALARALVLQGLEQLEQTTAGEVA